MSEKPDILNAKVLIVDDQAINCQLLETILQGAGYTDVTTTTEPTEVAGLHAEHHYDLILLDLQMPGMDGFAVMQTLQAADPAAYLAVIVITAHEDHKIRALKAGARDFISKPFDIDEVLLRVRNLLEMRLAHLDALRNSQRLATLALRDPLTGLANRRLLEDRVEMALSTARRERGAMALLYLDLDGFKNVNDTLGHPAGDLLLQQVAQRLLACVRANDTVARLGGDEFVITLWEVRGDTDVRYVATKLIEAVSRAYELDGATAFVTTSMGIAIYPQHGVDADGLMRGADAALYEAKAAGKNVYRMASDEPGAARDSGREHVPMPA
jgi:diguanylate cyclase (GGDEF)-like protein